MSIAARSTANKPTVFSALPTPLAVAGYPEHRQLRKTVTSLMSSSKPSANETCPQLLHYFDGESLLHRDIFREFRSWVEAQAQCFAEEILGVSTGGSMSVTDSWLNETQAGGFQVPHMHTNSCISGTYYLSRQAEHSPIVFSQARRMLGSPQATITLQTVRPTPFNSDFALHPQEGELVLWESHIAHGYPPSDKPGRISLSMNFMPRLVSNGRYSFRVAV